MSKNELVVKRNNPFIGSRWTYIVRNSERVESFGFSTFKITAQIYGKLSLWYQNWVQRRWERMP